MTEKFIPSLENYHALTKITEVEYLRRKVKELEAELYKISWQVNPDRMGGSFSQDEIDSVNTWR